MEQERERGITITAAAITCFWTNVLMGAERYCEESSFQHHRHPGPHRLHRLK
jgi:translation elongation factor EF-G